MFSQRRELGALERDRVIECSSAHSQGADLAAREDISVLPCAGVLPAALRGPEGGVPLSAEDHNLIW